MVKFEFTVDDVDAENIMGCMMDAETQCYLKLCDERANGNREGYVKWFEGRLEYLKELQLKMKNCSVEK